MTRLSWTKPTVLVALVLAIAGPALAQNTETMAEARLRKIEAEVAALQRKVFPGGDGTFFPQIQPAQTASAAGGTPASTPATDMLARMDSIESQVARLTAQIEENSNKIGKMEGRLATLEAARTSAVGEGTVAAAPAESAPSAAIAPAPKPTPAPSAAKPAATASAKPAATTPAKPIATGPSATRLAAVRAIEKPQTADAAEDEYSYGFRLWEAKFYPEAQQQLKMYLQKYPRHTRASFARNLLGRAYLDEGNLDEAGKWFYENYKADKAGARASDSVLYLAETWLRKKDTNRVCIALAQFVDDYPAEAAGRLRGQYDALRGKVKCN
jgi:TolA-binding protein